MVKSINYMAKAGGMGYYSAFLQDMLSKRNVICTAIRCIFDLLESADSINHLGIKNLYYQYFILLMVNKIYKTHVISVIVNLKKTNTASCQRNQQSQSSTELLGGYWVCQRYAVPNWQHSSENIHILWKLYRSIFSKCMYTSLELAMQITTFMAYPIANFRTFNLVKVGNSDLNKEQCHRGSVQLSIVDS
ncbi:hypothetical protein [Halotia branconii]|uniref:Uncharacterized protein n=1 Tax=Halotia branconii CENA392 TaxID=1539056 RepID=A0AAJ6NT61_9CYAN|nr:hypothetical protein [Halotia branconii]WGV26061.1 hypothetical protein QI031_00640 [Halotia branconii CENA392]